MTELGAPRDREVDAKPDAGLTIQAKHFKATGSLKTVPSVYTLLINSIHLSHSTQVVG